MVDKKSSILPGKITKVQAIDTGMAIILICLIIAIITKNLLYAKLAVVLLIINMIYPKAYKSIGILWVGLSQLVGTVISKILLLLIFYIILTPIGLLRKLLGNDLLKLKEWKKDTSSVFKIRDHTFIPNDINNLY